MSVYCRIASPTVFLRALHTVAVSRDGWATVVFTDSHVVLHVEGTDENMTATCTLPKSIFAEYAVVSTRFSLHIPTLMDALLMLGPVVLMSSTRAILAYPTEDAKLLVELTPSDWLSSSGYGGSTRTAGGGVNEAEVAGGGQRVLQSLLVTRNVREHVLDLRFADASLLGQVTVQGDVLRDVIADLTAAQCTEVTIRIDPKHGLSLRGEGGPYGEVAAHIAANSDIIVSQSREHNGETRVYTHHLALACGVRGPGSGSSTGSGGSSRSRVGANGSYISANSGGVSGGSASRDGRLPSADYILMGLAASGTGATSTLFGGFERLTLQVNALRQLSVLHTQRDHAQKVAVTVVVMPLCCVCDVL